MHIFGLLEEAGEPGESPCRHGEKKKDNILAYIGDFIDLNVALFYKGIGL